MSNRRLKHWEGSQTRLAFIKKELKRNERGNSELRESSLAQNYPNVTFSKSIGKMSNGLKEIEIAITTKARAQAAQAHQA